MAQRVILHGASQQHHNALTTAQDASPRLVSPRLYRSFSPANCLDLREKPLLHAAKLTSSLASHCVIVILPSIQRQLVRACAALVDLIFGASGMAVWQEPAARLCGGSPTVSFHLCGWPPRRHWDDPTCDLSAFA